MTLWEMYSFGQLPYGEMSGGEVSGNLLPGSDFLIPSQTRKHKAVCTRENLSASSLTHFNVSGSQKTLSARGGGGGRGTPRNSW